MAWGAYGTEGQAKGGTVIDLNELESSSALPSPIPGMVMVPMRSGTIQSVVSELRAARVCVERLRDHLAAFRDQQFLGNHDYDAAEKELLAYDEACK